MKKIKKILAMIMAMAMVMGLGMTTFAAESTNVEITVSNDYDSFYWLQIVEPDTSSTDGWKFVDDYASNFEGITAADLVTIGADETPANSFAKGGTINNTEKYISSELAEKLESFRTTLTTNGKKVTDETGKFTAESGGLYVILPEKEDYTYSPTLVYVPVNSKEAIAVKAKGASDQVGKELVNVTGGTVNGEPVVDGDDSVTANDTVEYNVTIKYPYFSDGADNKTFTITDTLTNGTFLATPALAITVDDAEFTDYTVNPETIGQDVTSITITFNNYNPTLAGTDVVLTYSVKVDSDVTSQNPFSNKVVATVGTNSTQAIVKSDTVAVEFKKVDQSNATLTGSVFALYEKGTPEKLIAYIADAVNTEGITLPADWDATKLVADGVADGTLKYDGLDANKAYYVQEVIAPDGYKVVDTKFDLVAGKAVTGYPKTTTEKDENKVMTTTTEYQYNDFTVADGNNGDGIKNTTLSSLPSTGGIGTTIFTIGGIVIMVAAAGLYFANRRKNNAE